MYYLDDMILETDIFLLLPGPILDIEKADKICSPAAHNAIEELQHNPGHHPQL